MGCVTRLVSIKKKIMKRIIINIDDNVTDSEAVESAFAVIKEGKTSKTSRGEQYCFHSVTYSGIAVTVTKQKSGTETFSIYPANVESIHHHHNQERP